MLPYMYLVQYTLNNAPTLSFASLFVLQWSSKEKDVITSTHLYRMQNIDFNLNATEAHFYCRISCWILWKGGGYEAAPNVLAGSLSCCTLYCLMTSDSRATALQAAVKKTDSFQLSQLTY